MSKFIPRASFPYLDSVPRSYFLGHHRAGLENMKSRISSVDLVIECRDFRVPASSVNPLFDDALGQKPRLIIYTKRDLGGDLRPENQRKENLIRNWNRGSRVLYSSTLRTRTADPILKCLRETAETLPGVTGARAMVVGMPNVGKSSLINTLRNVSLHKKKAARTGANPGVTRKIGTEIKIVENTQGGIYLLDTPGVFMPYVPDSEAMLKLALCGMVKDTIVPPTTLADYLLYQMNLFKPTVYHKYSEPTNEIMPFLTKIAVNSGRIGKGGVPDTEAAALWFIQKWRAGQIGAFMLDDVHPDSLEKRKEHLEMLGGSLSQARKAEKDARKDAVKHQASYSVSN